MTIMNEIKVTRLFVYYEYICTIKVVLMLSIDNVIYKHRLSIPYITSIIL